MLAEGFLRLLLYREEGKFASKLKTSQTLTDREDQLSGILPASESADLPSEAAPNQEEDTHFQGLKVVPPGPVGLIIPGCAPVLGLDPDFTVCLEDCSLLDQYPDLQVVDSGRISHNLRANIPVQETSSYPRQAAQQGEPASSIPDQGYLVMGASVNVSLDLPGSRLEPMSNSLLNGLLDKQLEEVYMQHLTDNLARCNSQLENSLLHGLVPPPQPSSHMQGPASLEPSVDQGSGVNSGNKISYLSAQNCVLCSSTFSSPVLRISEADS